MQTTHGQFILILLVLGLLAFPPPVRGAGDADLGARRVFAEILKPYEALQDYTVEVQARVIIPGLRVPDFTATLYFKRPDRFHIETRSFAPLPKNSGFFNPFQFDPVKNQIRYLRPETLDGARAEVYRVEPVEARANIRFFNVWIGGAPRRILQVESHSVRDTKALVKVTYRSVPMAPGTLLVPERVHVHLTFPRGADSQDRFFGADRDNPFSRNTMKPEDLPGEGDVWLTYGAWRLNTGLDDAIFYRNGRR